VRLTRHRNAIVTAALVVAVVVAGPVLDAAGQSYWLIALTRALLLSVLAVSTNLAWGFTGSFTLGQAVFFGAGAYAAALLSTRADVTSLIVLGLASAGAGLVAGLLIGGFLFFGRRRVGELYVGLVTLALTYAIERLANAWDAIGAGNGIPGLPLPQFLGTEIETGLPFFWLSLIVLLAVLLIGWLLLRSQFGLVMRAVRDDAERAEFLGYRRPFVQLAVFTGTAALGALAGGLYALEEGFASPSFLGVALSTQVLVYILLGGRGTLVGPVLGVLVLEVGGQRVQESLPTEWPIIVGAMLLLVIMFLPRGLMDLRARLPRRSARGAERAAAMTLGAASADPGSE
jgi:ABC-type branched-subunit amino acid transport system permease subunit